MSPTTSLSKLRELASETSSQRRRELLRDITDLYFANQNTCSTIENEHFDQILCHVTKEMDKEVRKEVAKQFAPKATAPLQLLRQLANDEIDIAGPVLAHSSVLQDGHLREVIKSGRQPHMRAISTRENLGTEVTSDLVQSGDDQTLVTLASNRSARFDRKSMQTMVSRSEQVIELQSPLVEHQDLPADLMNEMYLFAEKKVRARILQRNEDVDPDVLQEALAKAKSQAKGGTCKRPEGFQSARNTIDVLHKSEALNGQLLLEFERNGERLKFTLGLAKLAQVNFDTIDRIMQRTDTDALALICRAIGFDSSLFVTIALLTSNQEDINLGNSREIRQMFVSIPENAAKRTLRFWQMRQKLEV